MRVPDPGRYRLLAAEYALGTLRGPARRRFERLAARDPAVRAELTLWESAFASLAPAPVTPPARAWAALDLRLHAPHVARLPSPGMGAGAWRAWALVASAASVVLACALWVQASRPPRVVTQMVRVEVPAPTPYVALLSPGSAQATYLVAMMPEKGLMKVAMTGTYPVDASRKCLELWVLDDAGKPHSLGVLPEVPGEMQMPLPRGTPMPAQPTLAVSIEPKGGSPTGQPTGPVIGTGRALRTS